MNTLSRTLLIGIFFVVPLSVQANPDCIKGLIKIDMCAKARELSDGIALALPMKMSQNMGWESVMAIGTLVQAHIRLAYDRKTLESLYSANGLKISQATDMLKRSAMGICQEGKPTRAFIDLGGTFKYVYSFVDGEKFTEIEVSSCPQ